MTAATLVLVGQSQQEVRRIGAAFHRLGRICSKSCHVFGAQFRQCGCVLLLTAWRSEHDAVTGKIFQRSSRIARAHDEQTLKRGIALQVCQGRQWIDGPAQLLCLREHVGMLADDQVHSRVIVPIGRQVLAAQERAGAMQSSLKYHGEGFVAALGVSRHAVARQFPCQRIHHEQAQRCFRGRCCCGGQFCRGQGRAGQGRCRDSAAHGNTTNQRGLRRDLLLMDYRSFSAGENT